MFNLYFFDSVKSKTATKHQQYKTMADVQKVLEDQYSFSDQKTDAKLFSTWRYTASGGRKNAISTNILVLDIDAVMTNQQVDDLVNQITGMNKTAIIYDTYSSENDKRRIRIMLPLDKQYQPDDIKKMVDGCAKLFGIEIDVASKNTGQIYYLPTVPTKQEDDYGWRVLSMINEKNEVTWTKGDFPVVESISFSNRSSSSSQKMSMDDRVDVLTKMLWRDLEIEADDVYFHRTSNLFYVPIDGKYKTYGIEAFTTYIARQYQEVVKPNVAKRAVEYLQILQGYDDLPKPQEEGLYQCDDGILDVKDNKRYANDPTLRVLRRLPVTLGKKYSKTTPVKWLKFLDETFDGAVDKNDRILLLQQFMGYVFTDHLDSQLMLWMVGAGSNGKSVILSVLRKILGNRNVSSVPLNQLGKPFSLFQLEGKMLNTSDETDAYGAFYTATLKEITSSGEVTVERKGMDMRDGHHHAKLVSAMNHLPKKIVDDSYGLSRRLRVLHFENIVTNPNPNLVQELMTESSAIIAWAIEGLRDLEGSKRPTVPSVTRH